MAPEQALGQAVTAKADIYSWAATVVFAATGRPPTLTAALTREYLGVSSALFPVVQAALAENAEDRPSAEQIFTELMALSPSVVGSAAEIDRPSLRSINPRTAMQWARKSKSSLESGMAELALFESEQGIKLDAMNALCHFRRGMALIELDDRAAGVKALRLASEMDPDSDEIVAGVTRALAASPDVASKAIALRMSIADMQQRDLYVAQLVAIGAEGVMKAFEVAPDHPRVVRAYGEMLTQEIVSAERVAEEARLAAEESRTLAARYRDKGYVQWGRAQEVYNNAQEAVERANEARQKLAETVENAYRLAPSYPQVRRKYALTLLEGQPADLLRAYRLGRDNAAFLNRFAVPMLSRLDEKHLKLLMLELADGTSQEFELFVDSFIAGVRASCPSASDWRIMTDRMARRASIIETVGQYSLERLASDRSYSARAVRNDLEESIAVAYAADSDGLMLTSGLAVASTLVIVTILSTLTSSFVLTIPVDWWIPAAFLIAGAAIAVISISRFGNRAAPRRKDRVSRLVIPLQADKARSVGDGGDLSGVIVTRTEISPVEGDSGDQNQPLIIDQVEDG